MKSPILGGWSRSRGRLLSAAESYNVFLELIETRDGYSPGSLYNAPGLDLLGSLGDGPVRGLRDLDDILYVVSGNEVYSLTPNGIGTLLGNIGIADTPVSMFTNSRQLMITDGVGAWLVPGGYPLTGGSIITGGGLYAVGDTITLQGDTGDQTAYAEVTVTALSDNPATGVDLVNDGTGYSSGSAVATANINGMAGVGSGLTVDITTGAGGAITGTAVNVGGTGYSVGDTGTITSGGGGGGLYQVTTVSLGVVTALRLLRRGDGYSNTTGATTARGQAVPANVGVGLTLNVTAAAGAVTGIAIASGGRGYVIGAVGSISGGGGDATWIVTAIGASGTVSAVSITRAGAYKPIPVTMSQHQTSGSGSGFTFGSLVFGDFVGLVPIPLPAEKPIMGDTSDGYGLLIFQGSQKIYASDNEDLSTWDPLRFGVANQSGDNCAALKVIHNEVFVLKERNAEVWANQGLANFPFAPLTGVHMQYGNEAPFSTCKVGDRLVWIEKNEQGGRQVVAATGYNVKPISTQAVQTDLDADINVGDAIGYSFVQGGHLFYVLVLPEADKTWVYDATTSELAGFPLWHRIAAWDTSGTGGRWRRHWGNAFWPWRGFVKQTNTPVPYQPYGVDIPTGTFLFNAGLIGLPPTFTSFVYSIWLYFPDTASVGMIWALHIPGDGYPISIGLQNDVNGTPQIYVTVRDAADVEIVAAQYEFFTWDTWVNILVSVDTATQKVQVYANTIVAGALVETQLAATSEIWTSSNPIPGGSLEGSLF